MHVNQVVVINDTATTDGGAAKLALALAVGLKRQGQTVRYFAGDNGESDLLDEAEVPVSAGRQRTLYAARARNAVSGIYNQRAALRLRRFISEIDTPKTVYHLHAWAQILSPAIFESLKPVAHRTVLTLHDFFITCPNGSFFNYPKDQICELTPLSGKCALTNCDKRNYAHKLWRLARQHALRLVHDLRNSPITLVIINDQMEPYLARSGMPKGRTITIGNPTERFADARVEAESNKEILFVGRLQKEKGVDLLAAAARDAGVALKVVGEGPLRSSLLAINADAEYTGWKGPADVQAALKTARVLVMPSRCVEPFGLVAGEALCAGVPVIFSDGCLLGDKIAAVGAGRRIDIYDHAGFVSALRHLTRDEETIRGMSEKAWEHAFEIAQPHAEWVRQHMDLYDRLILETTDTLVRV